MELEWIADLDGDAACVAVEEARDRLQRVEVEQFFLAAHWVTLHDGDTLEDERRARGEPARGALPGMERARPAGAHGTPRVAEFAAMELGALLGVHWISAQNLMRDAVNVRHRHPRLSEALRAGGARVWQARRVAQLCAAADLDVDQAGWVDAVTTPYLASLPWARFEKLVEAKIIEADPAAAEARRRAAAMARFVRAGRTSEHGLTTLVARADAGDVIIFVAMVDRVAEILAERGDTDPIDVRRSKAIGILATPLRAVAMLLEAAQAHADRHDDQHDDESRNGSHDGHGDDSSADNRENGESGDGSGAEQKAGRPGSAVALRDTRETATLPTEPRCGRDAAGEGDDHAADDHAAATGTGGRPKRPEPPNSNGGGVGVQPNGYAGGRPVPGAGSSNSRVQPDLLTDLDLPLTDPAHDHGPDVDRTGYLTGDRAGGLCAACAGTGHTGDTAAAGGIFTVSGQYIRPGPFLAALRSIDPADLLPPAVLYLHAHADTVSRPVSVDRSVGRPGAGDVDGCPTPTGTSTTHGADPVEGTVARMERVGPITRDQLIELLGHTHVRPIEVLDLPGQTPVDGYEIPDRLREALHLAHPACAGPYAVNLTRRKDVDHVVPYDRVSDTAQRTETAQTGLHNLAPLTRLPHRAKTHGRWRLTQNGPGSWSWRSPHGYHYRVDHTGTHRLGRPAETRRSED